MLQAMASAHYQTGWICETPLLYRWRFAWGMYKFIVIIKYAWLVCIRNCVYIYNYVCKSIVILWGSDDLINDQEYDDRINANVMTWSMIESMMIVLMPMWLYCEVIRWIMSMVAQGIH